MADARFHYLFCSKEQRKILTCGGCNAVHYCSKDCQRKHWPIHKASCNYKQKTNTKPTGACSSGTGGSTGGSASGCPTTEHRDFSKALKVAERLFPGRRVETELAKLLLYDVFCGVAGGSKHLRTVMILQVCKVVDPFSFSSITAYMLIVKDGHGVKLPISMLIRNPRPHFTWSEIKSGTFICIRDAVYHEFFKYPNGLPITDPQDILLLNL